MKKEDFIRELISSTGLEPISIDIYDFSDTVYIQVMKSFWSRSKYITLTINHKQDNIEFVLTSVLFSINNKSLEFCYDKIKQYITNK